jgi:hypothetical protein
MAAIVLQFSTEAGWQSWAIRVFERGWCSHVDTVMPDGWLLGARSGKDGAPRPGVQLRPPGYAPFTRLERVELVTTEAIAGAYYAFVQAQLGKPYDMTAIAAFAFDRDWRAPDSWFCSEVSTAGLEQSGFVPRLATPANRVTPGLEYFLCSAFRR